MIPAPHALRPLAAAAPLALAAAPALALDWTANEVQLLHSNRFREPEIGRAHV